MIEVKTWPQLALLWNYNTRLSIPSQSPSVLRRGWGTGLGRLTQDAYKPCVATHSTVLLVLVVPLAQ